MTNPKGKEIEPREKVLEITTRKYEGISRKTIREAGLGVAALPWFELTAQVDSPEEARADAGAWAEEFRDGDPGNRVAEPY